MKQESIIKTGKSGQEIIKVFEAGIEGLKTDLVNKQLHIVALEKEIKRLKAKKSWRAAVYERISLIGRKHDVANGKD